MGFIFTGRFVARRNGGNFFVEISDRQNGHLEYILTEAGTHAQCALLICPELNASLACPPDHNEGQFLGKNHRAWVGLYQDHGAEAAEAHWKSATSGCRLSSTRLWHEGESIETGGEQNSVCAGMSEGSLFEAPCEEKMACLCEPGAITTREYASLAGA